KFDCPDGQLPPGLGGNTHVTKNPQGSALDGFAGFVHQSRMPPESRPERTSADLTPSVGGFPDVAPLGHPVPKPAHEQTADEDPQLVNWDQVAATAEFRALLKAKLKFVAPATVFFMVYYFALPVLVGYERELMEKKIFGVVN